MTNSDFRHFDPARRIEVDLASLDFKVMNDLFAVGEEYIEELAKANDQEKKRKESTAAEAGRPRKRKTDTLREREPW